MGKTNPKIKARQRRRQRIRKRVYGTAERPRLAVFRSNRHIYVQVVDDDQGVTITSACSLSPEIREQLSGLKGKKAVAEAVGRLVAQRVKARGITRVAFDRGGFLYHGRVKALAEGAREGGLEF